VSELGRVGFVGLGRMGTPLSLRLASAGYELVGYDLSSAARERAAGLGLVTADNLLAVADRAACLVIMLPTSKEVTAVLSDQEMLSGLAPEALVIDMSSSQPLCTRALAEALAERGVRMVDAPVSGGVRGAETGKLTIMAGGSQEDVARAGPLLGTLGQVVHAGKVGCGHAAKALNNLLSATHLWATGEAMLAGERFGIEPEVLLSIFNSSSGRSGSTDNKWPNFILPGTFNSGFGLRLMVKDMGIAVELADQVGAPRALGASALSLWQRAADDLSPDADHTEVARWLETGATAYGD